MTPPGEVTEQVFSGLEGRPQLLVVTDCDHPSTAVEVELLEGAGFEVRVDQCSTEEEVIASCAGAIGLLTQYAPITRRTLDSLPTVRAIARYGTGLDNIDVEAAAEAGVRIVSAPDYATGEVSDHTIGLILALTRRIVGFDREVRLGIWDFRAGGPIHRTATLTLGVLGLGRIGSAVARKATSMGFAVRGFDPAVPEHQEVEIVGFDELLASSDVVTVHVPLSDATKHLIDRRAIQSMRPGAFLVNTSRGGVVDEEALLLGLSEGQLGGAALDVFETEPLDPSHPLLASPNLIVTPHVGFYSEESLDELKRVVAQRLLAEIKRGSGSSLG